MTDDKTKEIIQQAIDEAKHLEKGEVYVLFLDRRLISHVVVAALNGALRDRGVHVFTVLVRGPVEDVAQLYKVKPE